MSDKYEKYDELLSKVALKDHLALHKLYDLSASSLMSVANSVVRNDDVAKDVLQDAFVIFWTKAHTYNAERGVAVGWMNAIVRNKALAYIRKHQRRAEVDIDLVSVESTTTAFVSGSSPERGLEKAQIMADIELALSGLDDSSKRAVMMAYFEGYKGEEIAIELGLPLNTVKSKLRRGLSFLRGHLERSGVTFEPSIVAPCS